MGEQRQIDRGTDRGMTGGTFHRVSHGKLLSRLSAVSGDTACPAFPPALLDSLLNVY